MDSDGSENPFVPNLSDMHDVCQRSKQTFTRRRDARVFDYISELNGKKDWLTNQLQRIGISSTSWDTGWSYWRNLARS